MHLQPIRDPNAIPVMKVNYHTGNYALKVGVAVMYPSHDPTPE
jgi:hypothetical protein